MQWKSGGHAPTQKLKPVPKKGVAMRVPTMSEISDPETEGPSKGVVASMRRGPGSLLTGVPAKAVPSVAAVADIGCGEYPLDLACCSVASRSGPGSALGRLGSSDTPFCELALLGCRSCELRAAQMTLSATSGEHL